VTTPEADPRPARLDEATGDAAPRHEEKVFFVLTLVIGAIVGLAVVAFILLTEQLGSRLLSSDGPGWQRVLAPALGALISGWLLYRYFPGARGSGIPQTKTALALEDGRIPLRTVIGKFGCSSLSLASGIALGREGPSVHVGAGIASVIGQRLGLSTAYTKRLLPVGASAAVAAAFNTPIAAVLFTLEEVVGDLHAPVLGSVVLASATAWMVLHLVLGDEPLFHVPSYQLVHPLEFVLYAVLGLVGGLVSTAFVKLLLALRDRFKRLPHSTVWFQPAVGGLLIGLMGWFVPSVLGVGYEHVGDALNGKMALGAMALLLALKLVATATGYASGNAGGIFGPSLFLGAMLGGAVGSIGHSWFPDYTGGVGAYALVGMGAAFAGIIRVPFTSAVMIFEITRDYTIIVPVMIANLVSYFIASRLQPTPIYDALLEQDGIHLPARRDSRDDPMWAETGPQTGRRATSTRALLTRLTVVVSVVVIASGLLAYRYRAARAVSAQTYLDAGLRLADQYRDAEAVEQFRHALAISGSTEARLALGGALVASDQPAEAAIYFGEALRNNPTSGPANLGLARAYARLGRTEEAVLSFERAVVGDWKSDSPRKRLEARLEFADYLAAAGERRQAVAQLVEVQRSAASQQAILFQTGQRLLKLDAADDAASLYRSLVQVYPGFGMAHRGLGDAEMARYQYLAALDAYRNAKRLQVPAAEIDGRLTLCERVVATDPRLPRLPTVERYRRSQALLTLILARVGPCTDPGQSVVQPDAARRLLDEAGQRAVSKTRPPSLGDATQDNLDLGEQVWAAKRPQCPPAATDALDVLMKGLVSR